MRSVGVDLAAQAATTALATIEWGAAGARIEQVRVGCDDDAIVAATESAQKVGIDCPFGWPVAFHDLLVEHRAGHVRAPDDVTGKEWRRGLVYRSTDLVTWQEHGRRPLSVSADLIAHPAMRCAGLLGRLALSGVDVARDGSGRVVETYPAASLKCWGLPHRGYKGPTGTAVRHALAEALFAATPWLDPRGFDELCRDSDHALDAVVAALTARAAATGRTAGPLPNQAAAAAVEGWIHVPTGSLTDLSLRAPDQDG